MWLFKSKFLRRELRITVFVVVFVLGILPHVAVSQDITHSFKITGNARMPVYSGEAQERSVEYDPARADHLIITSYRKNGYLLGKTQFLFKGKKFNLSNVGDYITSKELLKDGNEILYSKKESPESELIFKANQLQQQTFFYPNGNKQSSFQGKETSLNGEFKMWDENGHLSFSGNYKNSLKEGEFESFDASGNSERKGIYEQGKLISGESVVQDLVYDKPDVAPQLIVSDSSLNDYLRVKTAGLAKVKELAPGIISEINLNLTIGKTGHVDHWESVLPVNPSESEILGVAFNGFPEFKPALLEGAPVRSTLNMEFKISNQGLKIQHDNNNQIVVNENDSLDNAPYSIVEEMPQFPGGEMAFRKFLSNTVRYPRLATEKGITGKVYVNFIVKKDGTISNIVPIVKVNPILDAEAVRVIRSMPKWIPGRQNGKLVNVSYTVPINFVMQ